MYIKIKSLPFKNNCCRSFAFARTILEEKGELHTYFCLKENKKGFFVRDK